MQHDFDITTADANTGSTMRAQINAALQALANNSGGVTEPATKYPYMFWSDTTTDTLKMRNAANNAWLSILTLSTGSAIIATTAAACSGNAATSAACSGNSATATNATTAATCSGNAATATKLSTTSGTAPLYGARAWVSFNGVGAVSILGSGNVASVTDNGVGDYTINFTTAMPNALYAFVGTIRHSDTYIAGYSMPAISAWSSDTKTAASLRIRTARGDNAAADFPEINIVIFA